jgi:DNA-binding transcriptional LysR family regulator
VLPSLESLRCFAAAAKLLNFRAAARSVALTPAALGARIAQLEDQLGVLLFVRTTRSVRLTREGLDLVPLADRALRDAAECLRVGTGVTRSATFDITVGTRHELGMSWLLPQWKELEAVDPAIQFHLYFGAGPDLLLRVRTLDIDCAVTSQRFTDPKLDAVRLHREDYAFVGARSLLERAPVRRATDARAHTLFDISAELPLFRHWRDAPGGGDEVEFARIVRLGTVDAVARLVRGGSGLAVLPEYIIRRDLERGSLRKIFPRVVIPNDWFRLVFRADDGKRSIYERLAQVLLRAPLR